MKEKLTNHNWLLKLISVILAVILWLIVVNINHPEVTKSITVRNVVYENEETIINSGYTYSVDSLDRGVVISVPVEQTDANKVKADDFQIVVDLASMGPYGAVLIDVQWLGSDNYKIDESEITWKTTSVNVTLEEVVERTYSVQISTEGTPAEGYILGNDITLTPKSVGIKAPKSVLEQIHSVGISVDVEEASSEISGEAQLILYDVTGEELQLQYSDYKDYEFSISNQTIGYTIPLLKTKEVGLRFGTPEGTVAEGYRYTGIQGANQKVHIAGLKAVLADIDAIEIPSEVLNLDGADQSVELTLSISDYVPVGVTVESDNELTVVLVVEPLIQVTRELDVKQIRLEGASEDYTYTLTPVEDQEEESEETGTAAVSVVIEGLEEDLLLLPAEEIDAYISVENLKPGTHTVPVEINLDTGYTLVASAEVTVTVAD
jgi:YbbR domain-containing protein